MAPDPAGSDHFARSVAYSTGLRAGRFIVDILADLFGAFRMKGNKVSTTEIEVPVPPVRRLETEAEYAERIRAAIRRGIKAAEEGRVRTHEEALRRLAPWLGD
jgi:hypothetical protein